MKRLFYVLCLLVSLAAGVSACTDENVAPKTQEGNGGGGIEDDILKKQ